MTRSLLIWALALALLGDIALAYANFAQLRLEARLRLDPFELDHYAPHAQLPRPAAGVRRVVLFGDSRARSWPEPAPLSGFEFVNRGIGYQTTRQVLGRFERDVAALAPSVVVLQLGVNDLDAARFLPERSAQTLAECERNIAAVVGKSTQLGARVVLTSIFSIGSVSWLRAPFVPSDLPRSIIVVNRFLRGLRSDRVELLDTQALLDGAPGRVKPEYQRDFLHINERGYARLDAALHRALARMFPR